MSSMYNIIVVFLCAVASLNQTESALNVENALNGLVQKLSLY